MGSVKPLHVAIIGGGIGGAVLGVALKHKHISFTIYESRSAFGEVGAGLGFGANSHLAMQLISSAIWEGYQSRASFNGWEEKQNVWFDFTVGEKGENEGERIIEVIMPDKVTQSTAHRAHFLDELVKLLPPDSAEFNKRLVEVEQKPDKVVCAFADGTIIEADAVVGCDGIRSATRSFVYEEDLSAPVFTQKVAYRGLVPMEEAEKAVGAEKARNRQMYLGHGGHVLTFPVAKGAFMNVVAFHSSQSTTWHGEWIQQGQKESLKRDFGGWGESVTKIIELLPSADVWAIFDHPQVPTFHKERLCLLGDAAHATSPHFGQGAGMALEDAYVLSNLLSLCSSPVDVVNAFEAYDFVRVPRAMEVTSMSREQGERLDLEGKVAGDDLKKLARELDTVVRPIWNEDLKAHLNKAIKRFEGSN